MGRNLSHSPWFQRVRPENNLLFRLSFRVGKEGMKWVQGPGGCDSLTLNSLSVPLTPGQELDVLNPVQAQPWGVGASL